MHEEIAKTAWTYQKDNNIIVTFQRTRSGNDEMFVHSIYILNDYTICRTQ